MKISGTYVPKRWDEKPYELLEERVLSTRTTAEFAFSGDIEGHAVVEYLMFYQTYDTADPHRSKAQYVGMMRVAGTLQGKQGSFVMKDSGVFGGGAAQSSVTIIPGSGTGELAEIAGSGSYRADPSGCVWELDVTS